MNSTGFVTIFKKAISRVFLLYLILYCIPFPLNVLPSGLGAFFSKVVASFWQWLTPLLAENLMGYKGELSFNGRGSGDTLYDFLVVPTRFCCALVLLFVWSLYDKFRKSDTKIWHAVIVLFRYYLAFFMFTYGFVKVFYLQFPELSLMNLTGSYGDSSPMGLLWKFMGHSEAYSIFTGMMEVFGGVFLLFRRTKTLGALITFGIMLNVFLLNMSFDVPAKLFSFHLLVFALLISLTDAKNIVNFFFRNKPTEPVSIKPYFINTKKKWLGHLLKGALIFLILFANLSRKLKNQKKYGKYVPKHVLYGIYDVQHYIINGDTLPPLTTDTDQWKQLIVDKRSSLLLKMNGKRVGMQHQIDSLNNTITLTPFVDEEREYTFNYTIRNSLLFLTENKGKDVLLISATKREREDFFLINRGFHWINEFPMNR